MNQPPSSPQNSSPQNSSTNESSDDQEFLEALAEAEEALNHIKERYTQVSEAQERQRELRTQLSRTQGELRQHRTKELRQELKRIKVKLSELDIVFESRLVDPFWMAIRFGGLGIVIGWVLHLIITR
ncbi:MAG: hypothetical protein VKL39_10480 [Leptolyngbyaceae bacterium]|nr:hypothetical protein [Leptolyngbyaceae bacterium]